MRKEVKGERSEKERQSRVLDQMRSQDGIELDQLEEAIGWKCEGVKGKFALACLSWLGLTLTCYRGFLADAVHFDRSWRSGKRVLTGPRRVQTRLLR